MRIGPGTYREQVVVGPAKRDIVIRGTDRNRVVLDGGGGTRFNGITVHADGVAVENLTVRGYATDGIVFTPPKNVPDQLNGWRASFVTAANNGLHGIEALRSRGGTIDHVLASGHGAAGFRIGNCRPCDSLVTDSVAERGMAGFEGSDSGGNVVVARSFFRENRVGVLLALGRRGAALPPAGHHGGRQRDRGQRQRVGARARRGASASASSCAAGAATGWRATASPATPGPACCSRPPTRRPPPRTACRATSCSDNGVDLALAPRAGQRTSKGSCFAQNRFRTSLPGDIEKVLPCQSDVPLRAADPTLPMAPPGDDWRNVRLPAPQPSLPDASTAKPKPARRPGRIDVARVGVPGQG